MTRSLCSRIASEIGQKITPAARSVSRNVVTTETLSKTASTAMGGRWPSAGASAPRHRPEWPAHAGDAEFGVGLRSSGSTSSRDFGPGFFLAARNNGRPENRSAGISASAIAAGHGCPRLISLKTPIEHPLRLIFPGGNITYDIFIEAFGPFPYRYPSRTPLISDWARDSMVSRVSVDALMKTLHDDNGTCINNGG
ncbi:hypothetical protein DOFOFD_11775 [Acetobacteraceae bacterium EV16P]|uniref:Uncharacterized protein n=1 Tax=Sorlinia euscelidii TaxID=3081148 RepID=A0ABU7U586_9PROT